MWDIGKWFTFWGCGVRLFLAGVMQVARPGFTAESIFNLHDPAAHGLVREIGLGNLSLGTIGLVSLFASSWVVPAAVAGGLYYGLAGLGHLVRKDRNSHEQVAMISDLLIAALLAVFIAREALHIF
jgi:hypothetical protein